MVLFDAAALSANAPASALTSHVKGRDDLRLTS